MWVIFVFSRESSKLWSAKNTSTHNMTVGRPASLPLLRKEERLIGTSKVAKSADNGACGEAITPRLTSGLSIGRLEKREPVETHLRVEVLPLSAPLLNKIK